MKFNLRPTTKSGAAVFLSNPPRKRWTWWVSIILTLSSGGLIIRDEISSWEWYEFKQVQELRQYLPFDPVLSNRAWGDQWVPAQVGAVHTANVPAALLIGWYAHPFLNYVDAPLGYLFKLSFSHIQLKPRVVILDAIFVLGIWLQWYFLGFWLRLRMPLADAQYGVAILIVTCAFFSTTSTQVCTHGLLPALALVLAMVGWIFFLFLACISVFIWLVRKFRTQTSS